MKPRRKSRKPPQVRQFQCPSCGRFVPATKIKSRTAIGHIKTMYCFFCQEEQDFVQVD